MAKNKYIWNQSTSASANAREQLPKLLQEYFKYGRELMQSSSAPAAMHRFRLETKALRYTLELFRPCYGPGLERLLASLRKLQDCLGELNDCAATQRMLAARLPKQAPARLRMDQLLKGRIKRKSAELKRYWWETFDRPDEETRLVGYLSRPAS